MAGEERVLVCEGQGSDRVLDQIGVHFDPIVLGEAGQALQRARM